MIVGIIHPGSGLGDSLFSYIATRVRAADLGVDFGFVGKEFFKGASFMNLDFGEEVKGIEYHIEEPSGKLVVDSSFSSGDVIELNTPYYDPEFNFIEDDTHTIIDGYGAQDIRYFEHRLEEVREWLKVENTYTIENDACVINFRGGEYQTVPDLFLPKEYWNKALNLIYKKYPDKVIEIHTDDSETANKFFPGHLIIPNIEINWKAIRYAKHLIISNSAFAILPALLNENVKEVIAPKFWAGRNVGEWRRPANYYSKFQYI